MLFFIGSSRWTEARTIKYLLTYSLTQMEDDATARGRTDRRGNERVVVGAVCYRQIVRVDSLASAATVDVAAAPVRR